MLEVFSGSGTVSHVFSKNDFVPLTLDCVFPSPDIVRFYPNILMDFHDCNPDINIPVVPDFCWVSPECTTYSNLPGSKHRVAVGNAFGDPNLAISPEAREQDFLFSKIAYLLKWIRERKPYALFAIENPAAKLKHMPMMVSLTLLHYFCLTYHWCIRNNWSPVLTWRAL